MRFEDLGVESGQPLSEPLEFSPGLDPPLEGLALGAGDVKHLGPARLRPRQVIPLVKAVPPPRADTRSLAARTFQGHQASLDHLGAQSAKRAEDLQAPSELFLHNSDYKSSLPFCQGTSPTGSYAALPMFLGQGEAQIRNSGSHFLARFCCCKVDISLRFAEDSDRPFLERRSISAAPGTGRHYILSFSIST